MLDPGVSILLPISTLTDSIQSLPFQSTWTMECKIQNICFHPRYVLQWIGLTGSLLNPYYSCSKLNIVGGDSLVTCPAIPEVPQTDCYQAFGPSKDLLLNNTAVGNFCFDTTGVRNFFSIYIKTSTVNGDYCTPPVNADCDPRQSCDGAANVHLCEAQVKGILDPSFPTQANCAFSPPVCDATTYSQPDFCTNFGNTCTMLCLGKGTLVNTVRFNSGNIIV